MVIRNYFVFFRVDIACTYSLNLETALTRLSTCPTPATILYAAMVKPLPHFVKVGSGSQLDFNTKSVINEVEKSIIIKLIYH